MKKIIINKCYGGFGLSDEAYEWLMKNKGWRVTEYLEDGNTLKDKSAKIILVGESWGIGKYWAVAETDKLRVDKDLIECVEKLKDKASGKLAKLKIVEIPNDVKWVISEYDGVESIHEVHRSWK